MLAIKAQCDGTKIMLPRAEKFPVGQVIVVFAKDVGDRDEERQAWMEAQEKSFAKVWDNPEDAAVLYLSQHPNILFFSLAGPTDLHVVFEKTNGLRVNQYE